jgi:hypothetical protein
MFWFFLSLVIVIIAVLLISSKKKQASHNPSKNTPKIKTGKITQQTSIFGPLNSKNINNVQLEQALEAYNHTTVAVYIGTLDTGNQYALIIGTSDEWVNAMTYNWAKQPEYEVYGFSIKDNRWSYGSKVRGAPQLREIIKSNLHEIKSTMKTQEGARKEKERKYKIHAAEAEKEHQEYERREREEKAQLIKIQKSREPIVAKHFIGLEFEYNENKKKHESAQKDCLKHYYDIDLTTQTCSCKDFSLTTSKYKINDIRRLCRHLNDVIIGRELLKKHKDILKDFILKNIKGNTQGIYFDKLEDGRPYGIITYSWTKDLFIATPKTNKEGYLMVNWYYKNNEWNTDKGGKKYNNQIKKKIIEFFKE